MSITLTFDQAAAGIPAGSVDRGRTDIKNAGAIGATRAYPVTITVGNIPVTSTVDVLLLDEPPNSNPLLTQLAPETWTLEFDVGCWGPFRVRVTATINEVVVASATRRISIRSPGYHIAYPALSERTDPNATIVPTVPSVSITEMNEGATNRPLVDFYREMVSAIEGTSGGGGVIPDGSITEEKLAPALSDNLLRADGSIPLTANLDAAGNTISNLGPPLNPDDAVSREYVEQGFAQLGARAPCRLVATVAVTASGTQVVDGLATVAGDRLLLTEQPSPIDNGIWVAGVGAWLRAVDADSSDELLPGMTVVITAGAGYAESAWMLSTDQPILLGTSPLVFARVNGTGQIVPGPGLVESAINTLAVAAHADGSIVVGADDVRVGVLATDAQHGTRSGGTLHAVATPSVAGFESAADKTKLDSVAANAAALTSSAPASVGTANAVGGGTTAARSDHVHAHGAQTDGTLHAVATPSVAGFESAADKTKLDSVAANAAALTSSAPASVGTANAVGGGTTAARSDHVHAHAAQTDGTLHAVATTSVAGFESAADKTKLDSVAANAAALTSSAPASVGTTNAVGVGTTAARSDHVHAHGAQTDGTLHAIATPSVAGFESAADKTKLDGIETGAQVVTFARVQTALAAATSPIGVNGQPITNLGAPATDTDAVTRGYGLLSGPLKAAVKAASTAAIAFSGSAPNAVDGVTLALGDRVLVKNGGTAGNVTQNGIYVVQILGTGSNGTWVRAADADTTDKLLQGTRVWVQTGGAANGGSLWELQYYSQTHAPIGTGTPTWVQILNYADKTKLDGVAAGAAALASTTPASVGASSAVVGVASTAARADHTHAVLISAPSALPVGSTQATGASTGLARADHVHATPAAGAPTALPVGASQATGSAATIALSDHVHAIPGIATGVAAGFLSSADKSKLDGVEAGAQVVTFARVQTALAAASSAISVNAQRLTNLADPTGPQDAATKSYTDAIAQGLDVKASCRLVATVNVPTMGGAQVIDGIVTSPGDRLLLTAQTDSTLNGIWVGAGINWLRATDADTSAKVSAGLYTWVTEGTANADSGWVLTTNDPIVLGTSTLTFTQFSGAGQIVAGTGMTKSGNTLNVAANADGSIIANADDVQVGVLATDAQHGTRGGGTVHATVIAAGAAGFMTGADKTKLDGVATGAAAVLSVTPTAVDGSTGNGGAAATASRSDHRHQVTTGTPSGALSVGGANAAGTSNNLTRADHLHAMPAAGTPVALTLAGVNAPGSAATLALSDHVHALPGTAAPVALTLAGTNAAGVSTAVSRSDHVHALPASSTAPTGLTAGGSSAVGSSTSLSKADHVHALPAASTPLDNPGVAAVGTSTSVARADHQHASVWKAPVVALEVSETFNPASPPGTVDGITINDGDRVLVDNPPLSGIYVKQGDGTWLLYETLDAGDIVEVLNEQTLYTSNAGYPVQIYPYANYSVGGLMSAFDYTKLVSVQSSAAAVTSTAPTQITVTTAAAGSSSTAARGDHVHSVSTGSPVALGIGQVAGDGTSTALARADHSHATPSSGVPASLTLGATNSAGAALTVSRSDHVHALPSVATPVPLAMATASSAGTSANLVRSDHVHALPNSGTPVALTLAGSNSGGSAATLALSDHVHQLPLANTTPATLTVAGAASIGVSASITRADHLHAMPGLATTGLDGFLSAAEKAMLLRFPRVNQLRLSGESGASVMTADNAAISTIYLVPHVGNTISLYSGGLGLWIPFDIANPAGISLALSGMTTGRPYDVFCVTPAITGTPSLEILAWTSTSARATALALQDGVFVKTGDATRRYVGTILARSATTISWIRNGYDTTTAKCDIWNNDNRIPAVFTNLTTWTGSFPVGTANTWFQVATSYKTEVIVGRVVTPFDAMFTLGCCTNGTANAGYCGIALNASSPTGASPRASNNAGDIAELVTSLNAVPALGVNTLQFMALGTATAVNFFTTDDPAGAPPVYQFDCGTRLDY